MKLSVSLSDDVGKALEAFAQRVAAGNASLLVDLAIKRLLELPETEIATLAERWRLDRKAGATRDGWMRAFWRILGEEMGRVDLIDNPYAPRTYGAFYVVLLLNHMDRHDDQGDPFCPFVGPQTVSHGSPTPKGWSFDRSTSPTKAATTVASKLREFGVAAAA